MKIFRGCINILWNIRIQTRHDLTSGRLIKTLRSKSVETYFILQLRACALRVTSAAARAKLS